MKFKNKIKYLVLLIVLVVNQANGQSTEELFNIEFNELANQYNLMSVEEALSEADKLYENYNEPKFKIRVSLLKAFICSQSGNKTQAIQYAKETEKLATQLSDPDWKLRALGFLAAQYQNLMLYSESNEYLQKAEAELVNIKDEDSYNSYLNTILKTKALNYFAIDEFHLSLNLINQADSLISQSPTFKNRHYARGLSETLKGKIHFKLHQFKSSEASYQLAIAYLDSIGYSNDPLYGHIYTGFAQLAMVNNLPKEVSWDYFEKAIPISEYSGSLELTLTLYQGLMDYYKSIEDWDNYYIYSEKLINENFEAQKLKNQLVDVMYHEMNMTVKSSTKYKNILVICLVILVISLIGMAVYFTNKKKNNRKKFKAIIAVLENRIEEFEKTKQNGIKTLLTENLLVEGQDNSLKDSELHTENPSSPKIPKVTQVRILKKIEEFEDELLFLEASASLTYLANFCETNTKYVSTILKEEKGKDYSAYINEQRVFYIMEKLREDKAYRSYKISYLAKISGFSSHSVFSFVFKSIAGLSPSEFIYFINESKPSL